MKKIAISPDLSLPPDVVVQKVAFLGRTGSGKSHAACKMVEEMLENSNQVVVLDPVGVWWGLRLRANASVGYQILVLGGLKGDIPLEPTSGALIADLIVDNGISCVIDISQFESDRDKARFSQDWADRLFFRKKASPSAIHLVIDEAQEVIPQNPQKGEERMLHAFQRMWKLGRNFGIGGSIISQRPQEISKKALNQTELLFAFQMTGPQERKAIELWMSEKGIDTDIVGQLPGLDVGQCYAWSPQWLKVNKVIRIGPKKTFNSSAAPVVGGKSLVPDLASIDLEALQEKMKETIERAKENDPVALKAEIRKLKKELELAAKQAQVVSPPQVVTKTVDVPIFDKEDQKALTHLSSMIGGIEGALDELSNTINEKLTRMTDDVRANMERIKSPGLGKFEAELSKIRRDPPGPIHHTGRFPAARVNTSNGPKTVASLAEVSSLSKAQRTILSVLCDCGEMFTAELALRSGFTVNGYFNNTVSSLRSAGLIEPGQPIHISDRGTDTLGTHEPPMRLQVLQDFWLDKVGQARARILKHLLVVYPENVATADLAQATGYTVNGYFNNTMSSLRTAGLIVGRGTGASKASPVFFDDVS